MRHVGGEQELTQQDYFRELTNSGRSSLRWIIESAQLASKRLLLPDFLCEVILDVLAEYHIDVDFYVVDSQLSYQLPDNLNDYDALYLIKYFGATTASFECAVATFKQCVIVDDVFSPYPHILDIRQSWYSFNSLRKISAVADFSMLYSNQRLKQLDVKPLTEFATLKYQAKQYKYDYFNADKGEEQVYLSLFNQGESCLDNHKGIFSPSSRSVLESIDFYQYLDNERALRCKNYAVVCELLGEYIVPIQSDCYSFAPLLLPNRDAVRRRLMGHNIFLAVHWPEATTVTNELCHSILSIPLDSRYDEKDMSKICEYILS
ncbi:hypothetical protein [Moritella sp. Urea-trap-13]|uniref:hypothetical protein n=1 Tax=Moritella sp. Urea-trap-13 TaxID=2058327 RepID=UPI000C31DEFE|nr:hypothetical protein [Moritella sp. Urea-trap-13]PKH05294.1 hypothetical protein CXF93_18580 [Moritella sp. Urea-trap-13]